MARAAFGLGRTSVIKQLITSSSLKVFCRSPCKPLCLRPALVARSLVTQVTPASTNSAKTSSSPQLDSLIARGLYNEDVMKHMKSYGVKELTVTSDGKLLEIFWGDGHISKFHASWLRCNCHCPACRLDYNGMITVNFDDLDLDHLRIVGASMEGEHVVTVKWEDTGRKSTHEGPLLAAWLRQHCYSESADKERRAKIAMTFFEDKTIPEVGYEDIIASEHGIYRWLSHLSERGVCLVKDVPKQTGMVQKIAELIAPIQHTVYGEIFDVVSTPQPVNAAYSPVRLDLHMDQVHYESPPGIQFLHCVESYPVHLRIQRPILSLNHLNELVSVFWHPMLVGPLQVRPEDVEPFYKAYKYFFTMINSYQSIYKLRMVAGDTICFNNRRVLHGRGAYSNQTGRRHLQGTYVEISEFQSRLQVLHNKLGDGRQAVRCGSLDCQ